MTVLEATLEKLKNLPDDKIEAVAHYIDTINHSPQDRFGDLAGCMAIEEVDKMKRAIEAACERSDDW